jgi:hypothetical protein
VNNAELDSLAEIARDAVRHATQEVSARNGMPDDGFKVNGLIEEIGYLSAQLMYIENTLTFGKKNNLIRKFALLLK